MYSLGLPDLGKNKTYDLISKDSRDIVYFGFEKRDTVFVRDQKLVSDRALQ
jgi:hypothetical protein